MFSAYSELLVGVMASDDALVSLAVVAATCPLPFVALAVMMQLAGYGFTDLWDRRDGDAPFGRAGGEDFLRRKGIQKESVDP